MLISMLTVPNEIDCGISKYLLGKLHNDPCFQARHSHVIVPESYTRTKTVCYASMTITCSTVCAKCESDLISSLAY